MDRHGFSYLQDVLDAALARTPADFGAIVVLGPLNEAAYIAAYRGFEPRGQVVLPPTQIQDQTTAAGRAASGRKPVFIEDVDGDELYAPHRTAAHTIGYRSVLSIPLIGRVGDVLGVLTLMFRDPQHRSLAKTQTAASHGSIASLIIEAGRLKAECRRRAGSGVASEVPDAELKAAIRGLRDHSATPALEEQICTLGEQYVRGLVSQLEGFSRAAPLD